MLDNSTPVREMSVRFEDGSSIVRPEQLEWTPWALPGHSFKLLSINRGSGVWSCLMKVEPGVVTPIGRLHGNGYIYVMRGGYSDGADTIRSGQFNVQGGGSVRKMIVGADGLLCYVMFFGGISLLGENGSPTGNYIDLEWAYEAAAANGAARHLSAPVRREAF